MTDKSINASERLETQINFVRRPGYRGDLEFMRMKHDTAPDNWRKKHGSSGINPTHCTETQVTV